MKKFDFFYKILNTKSAFFTLFLLNLIIGIIIFRISSAIDFPDGKGYWLMGESILHGKFSSWYFLPKYYPETLRTPGYPLFLSFCQSISKSELLPKVIQFFIYFISVYICIRIIKKVYHSLFCINLFLLLLIPNIQIVYYSGYISSEILNLFFIVLTMYLTISRKNVINSILLALSCYCAFIIRPIFLLFPFIIFVYFVIKSKKEIKFSILFISIYLILLVPFGLWNKYNHGKFTITPIEGGAGAAHIGFWQLKLPDGYKENYYWSNTMGFDLTKPKLCSKDEQQENARQLEMETKNLLSQSKNYLTNEDLFYLDYMKKNNPGVFLLYNSKFTFKREQLLWQAIIKNIKNEPFYYIKSRIYHFIRFYVTGINYKDLAEASSFLGKVKVVFPFCVTLIFILGGVIFITYKGILKKIEVIHMPIFTILFWYFGIIHLPFIYQARYTIPIHLLIITTLSIAFQKKIKIEIVR